DRGQAFRLASTKPVDEFQEAKALGFHTKPVLIGPVTFLLLGKTRAAAFDRLELLDALLPVYGEVLARLAAAGATWVQLDEPSIALDRTPQELAAYGRAYRFLTDPAPQLVLLAAACPGRPRSRTPARPRLEGLARVREAEARRGSHADAGGARRSPGRGCRARGERAGDRRPPLVAADPRSGGEAARRRRGR